MNLWCFIFGHKRKLYKKEMGRRSIGILTKCTRCGKKLEERILKRV